MIKKIKVYPRDFVRFILETGKNPATKNKWALISIFSESTSRIFSDPEKGRLNAERAEKANCAKWTEAQFSDLTKKQYNEIMTQENPPDYLILFDEEKALEIIKFLNSIKHDNDIDALIINCAAGVSRSGAVGLFACRYLNLDEKSFMKDNHGIHPNQFVLETLIRMSNMNEGYEDWWSTIF